jgi:hypothetical protein
MSSEKSVEEGKVKKQKGRKVVPEVWQVVIECRDEGEQREWYERLVREGVRVRLLVL